MKRLTDRFKLISCILLALGCLRVTAQDNDSKKEQLVQNMVEGQHFVFMVQTVLPLAGTTRHIDPGYTVQVSKTTVICDLPYFGRAYTVPTDPSEGGIKFT